MVCYLKAAPWQCPEFSVETHFEALLGIHRMIQEQGALDVVSQRFFLVVQKRA